MTSVQQQALLIFAGVAGILVLASAIGYGLKLGIARGQAHAVIDNLNARVNAWWVMVIVIGLAYAFGRNGVIALFAIVSFFALREFATIAPTRRGDYMVLLLSFFLVTPVQYLLIGIEWYGLYSIFIPVYAFLLLPVLAVVASDTRGFLERTAIVQWGVMLCVFCISHVPALLTLDIPGYAGRNALLLFFLIIVVQSSDVLQYIWGRLFGRHKLAPGVSPSKTVEGLVGGILSATLIGTLLWWMTPFSIVFAAGISFVITVMGFLGGLVMSAIKRDRGIKDWGASIAGHGGMLDRLDSVCFSAPIFFHLVRYGWAG
ncbi:phosphatidate cytidylyltransferase [Salinisphaera sp.]|uniref:phosphatidate cytidylyltransferase n=1 Tax=Salinisphaera sp. TaxID=1914330 RepID=UPI002D773955|nr:phosphatidate cytidylyltransferase [Salinisphaera sp.]HET7315255.1 phosphatidate cytidylyltransferase [Salinisphaera sp.]